MPAPCTKCNRIVALARFLRLRDAAALRTRNSHFDLTRWLENGIVQAAAMRQRREMRWRAA